MQNVILHIDGMSCGGCVKSVTRALLAVSGVVKAMWIWPMPKPKLNLMRPKPAQQHWSKQWKMRATM